MWLYRQAQAGGVEDPLADLPPVMLWAWERPESLWYLNTERAGVAFLATTLVLHGDGAMEMRPRRQPIRIRRGSPLVAVVRIEAGEAQPPRELVEPVAAEVLKLTSSEALRAVQIDFDALESQREFYRALLDEVAGRLPENVRLSITALASWCIHDDWIRGLPIDEAVPMLFRLGAGQDEVWRYLEGGRDFRVPACRLSVGVSTDESAPSFQPGRRVYVFHPRSWSREDAARAIAKFGGSS